MARTAMVTKQSVTVGQPGLFVITLRLVYSEDSAVLFDRDFQENHWTGRPPSEAAGKVQKKMQQAIDDYKASEQVFASAVLSDAVTAIQNGLVV